MALTLTYTAEQVEKEVKVAISQLLCNSKHGRFAACTDCQETAAILAKPWAMTIMAAVCESYEVYVLTGKKKRQYVEGVEPYKGAGSLATTAPTLTLPEAEAAGRAEAMLVKLSTGDVNAKSKG